MYRDTDLYAKVRRAVMVENLSRLRGSLRPRTMRGFLLWGGSVLDVIQQLIRLSENPGPQHSS
jgi:hypothetical protein